MISLTRVSNWDLNCEVTNSKKKSPRPQPFISNISPFPTKFSVLLFFFDSTRTEEKYNLKLNGIKKEQLKSGNFKLSSFLVRCNDIFSLFSKKATKSPERGPYFAICGCINWVIFPSRIPPHETTFVTTVTQICRSTQLSVEIYAQRCDYSC
jgi:hypothetical protein